MVWQHCQPRWHVHPAGRVFTGVAGLSMDLMSYSLIVFIPFHVAICNAEGLRGESPQAVLVGQASTCLLGVVCDGGAGQPHAYRQMHA